MELKNQKILVTGGAGFIGSNLVDALSQHNHVIVLDDFSTGKRENLQQAEASGRLTVHNGSVLDYELVRTLVKEVDVIYHLAVQCLRVCFDRPHHVHEVNSTGTLNLLEAARLENPHLKRFIYCSSSEAYGTAQVVPMREDTHPLAPTTVYGASKLAGELYAHAYFTTYRMPTMVLRPFNTYGYREHHEGASGEVIPRFVIRILNGLQPIVFGDGSATRDFTFVSDTVESLVRAGECDAFLGQSVNLAYGQEVSIKEIADRLLKLLGQEKLGIQWEPERPGDVHRHFADVTRLQSATGWKPAINIEQGLQLYLDWFRKHYPDPAALLAECQTHNWKLDPQADAKVFAATPC
jgi:UDP-glucose 4-epimerase